MWWGLDLSILINLTNRLKLNGLDFSICYCKSFLIYSIVWLVQYVSPTLKIKLKVKANVATI